MRTLATSICLGFSAFLLAACGAESAEDPGEDVAESELTSLAVRLEGAAEGLAVNDRPRLKSRARGDLACSDRFEIDGRVRLTCTRNTERLEVILRDGKGLLVHKADAAKDSETFFDCTTSGEGEGGLPASLQCTKATLRDRGGHGGLSSPFASSVPGIDIPNAHLVGGDTNLLRGMAPTKEESYDQLFAAGIGAVLLFKNATGNGSDVADEEATLRARGLPASRFLHVPFAWRDLPSFEEPCMQVVDGLKFLVKNLAAGKKTFFHCTVGEDRTGLLAATYRLLTEAGLDAGVAWDGEMCERGYGAGNPLKPGFVVGQLENGLKPLYQKMAYLIATGALTKGSLDRSVCSVDPSTKADFEAKALPATRLRCGTSTLFEP